MKNGRIKGMTLWAVLTCVALVLSYIESFFPLQLVVPLPGMRLGLANIVSMMALYFWGLGPAFTILVLRCFLGAVFAGNLSGLFFSLTGGSLAMCCMAAAKKCGRFSVYGVSVLGAAAHNIGQVMTAMLLMQSVYVIGYLPYLLLVSLVTGIFIGAVSSALFGALIKSGQVPERDALR